MVDERELAEALKSFSVAELLKSTGPVPDDAELLRELRRRKGEIELDLARTEEAVRRSRAQVEAIRGRAAERAKPDQGLRRIGFSLIYLIAIVGATIAGRFLGWAWASEVLSFWAAPLAGGWWRTSLWLGVATAVVTLLRGTQLRRGAPQRLKKFEIELGLDNASAAAEEADAARQRRLVELVQGHVVDIVNRLSGPTFETTIYVGAADTSGREPTVGVGLSEVASGDNQIPVDARQRILGLIERLPGGSIGISGPRGVGKSTLLTSICTAELTVGNGTAVSVSTAAPIEYEGREFLLHLFSSLCRRVLLREKIDRDRFERSLAETENARWQQTVVRSRIWPAITLLGMTAIIMLFIATLIVGYNGATQVQARAEVEGSSAIVAGATASNTGSGASMPTATPNPLGLLPGPFAMLGVAALGIAVALALSASAARILGRQLVPRRDDDRLSIADRYIIAHSPDVALRCAEELRNIRFQRSFTSGWSGMLKVPAGLDLGMTGNLTLQQQAESLPELVERFRDFVAFIAREYGAVVFAIDELDKLKSRAEAEAFLNGIKSVFGIERCFYLISVSEDALSAFDRRGIGIRDAFDSALDEVLHVGFLDLAQSRALLNRRILRLPDPFLQLCHMLSGGLPRDLIRQARQLLEAALAAPGQELTMARAAEALIGEDLRAKLRATQIAIRAVPEQPETGDVLSAIAQLGESPLLAPPEAVVVFRDFIASLSDLVKSEDGRRLARLATELATYVEMMRLHQQIASMLSNEDGWHCATDLGLADKMAEVRQALEVGVALADARLAAIRKQIELGNAAQTLPSVPHTPAPSKGSRGANAPKPARQRRSPEV